MAKKRNAKAGAAKKPDEVAEGAARLLADSYTLYLKTHNYHWNRPAPTRTSPDSRR